MGLVSLSSPLSLLSIKPWRDMVADGCGGICRVDVNYRGSSTYGREYVSRLDGHWGIVDVQDCISTVQLLSSPSYSLIDLKRCTIRGGSAGGYTTLAALSLPKELGDRKVFAAGQSSYGISDLKAMQDGTHKFESRYLEGLLTGRDREWEDERERRRVLERVNKERSPILWVEKIEVPLLVCVPSFNLTFGRRQSADDAL
jgi:dipeptidyl aminopeptidase/acylaminoacyl peptidase